MLEVSLFGKPTVRLNALEVSLSTRKALGLVGYLALEGATSRAKLADLLWGELDDSAARTNLRQELRRIRATALEDCLLVEGDQLKLKAPLETDVTKFQNAINAEQFEAALEYCKGVFLEGTDWRGAPAFEEWVDAWRETLSSQRRNALKRQAVALEAAGNPRGALAAHLALLEEDELQEHHHREAMRLHSMLNERQEALARFERCRQILKQELGLEPLPETIRLAERIRSGRNSSLKPSKTAPSENPFQTPPMIGRDQLWTKLETSETSLILIEGEPGVGKTRLATEFANASGNTLILSGQELSSGTPLFPVASALRAYLANQHLELETIWRHEAARLVPELEPDAPSAANEALPEGRARFLEGLTHALIAAVQPNGTLLLDDFHWFDATSSELTVQLSKRAKSAGIKLIATARPSELSENPAATRAIQHLERDGLLTRLPLEPLSETMILSLVQAISGNEGGTIFATRLFTATAGNPLFVLETLRDLLEAGTLYRDSNGMWSTPYDEDTQDYAELPLAQSVRQAVLQRIDRLGPAVRRMLDAASLTGDDFQLNELTQATALDEWLGLEALERASSAGILRPNPQGHRFHHDLIRRSLSNALGADRRKLLHKRLAATLEGNHGEPARIADHLEQADLNTQAAPWRIKAAEAARAVYAYEDAIRHYAQALENGLQARDVFVVHSEIAKLWRLQDDKMNWNATLAVMFQVASELKEENLLVEVSLARMEFENNRGEFSETLKLGDALLQRIDLTALQIAEARLGLGNAFLKLTRNDEAEACLLKALKIVPIQAYELIARINKALGNCALNRLDFASVQTFNTVALAAYQRAGNQSGKIRISISNGHVAQLKGNFQEAIREFNLALKYAREIRDITLQRVALQNLVSQCLDLEDIDSAIYFLEESLKMTQDLYDPEFESTTLNHLSIIHLRQGKLKDALYNAQIGFKIAKKFNFAYLQAIHSITLSEIYLTCNNFTISKNFILITNNIAQIYNFPEFFPWVAFGLANCDLISKKEQNARFILEKIIKDQKIYDKEILNRSKYLLAQIYMDSNDINFAYELLNGIKKPIILEIFSTIIQNEFILNKRLIKKSLLKLEKLFEASNLPIIEKIDLMILLQSLLKKLNYKAYIENLHFQILEETKKVILNLPNHLHKGFLERRKLFTYN